MIRAIELASLSIIAFTLLAMNVSADCVADSSINTIFEIDDDGKTNQIPRYESCCMYDVCGLACPAPISEPTNGYAIAALIAVIVFFLIGAATYYLVDASSAESFFVGGRSLPLGVVAMTMAAQSIDSNALLGNVDNSYKFSFWDGKYQDLLMSTIVFTYLNRISLSTPTTSTSLLF